RLQGFEGDPELLAELAERLIGPWESAACALQVAEAQVSGRERRRERVRIKPLRSQLLDNTDTHDVATSEAVGVRLEKAEVDELLDALDRRAGSRSDLLLAE